ncbi:hypothetical protein L2E82_32115 [Cichorium intybus]|uniref:Uncharacterized protein n=1 Tax=Cichorium intybus TaxID=13427 RepID=A0ACB9BH47_CICIN|nr:hypothetical protein L2E82_32115 [Cichorium intybus]
MHSGADVEALTAALNRAIEQKTVKLAADVPNTEVVGKGDYFRFGMRDSLPIETSFLQKEEELLSNWRREYSKCSEGPRGSLSPIPKSDPFHSPTTQSNELFADEEERVGVPVKGGLYEVDLLRRHSFPVYWNGDNRRVLRGHWFALKGGLDWFPPREDVAEQLEFGYRGRPELICKGLLRLHVLFTSADDTWEAWLYIGLTGFGSIVKFGVSGLKLRRGYVRSQSSKPTQV